MTTTKEALEKARDALTAIREVSADLAYLMGRAANEGHEAGQSLAMVTRSKLDAALTAIEAALSVQGEVWYPIETAPKDGSAILTFPHYRITHWEEEISGFARLEQKTEEWEHLKPPPTHWMPLPSPPGSAPPALADDIAALHAENERLRAALEPFAKAADVPIHGRFDDNQLAGWTGAMSGIRFGDLRRARAVLKETDHGRWTTASDTDAEFCARARTDVPALLAEVERLREEAARLREQRDDAVVIIRSLAPDDDRLCGPAAEDHARGRAFIASLDKDKSNV